MENRLVFLEGLPGSGKTTFAKRLYDHLLSQGQKVTLYKEGDYNPLTYLWQAILTDKELEEILLQYPTLRKDILSQIKKVGTKNILAFTKVQVSEEQKSFYQVMQTYEVHKEPKERFYELYQDLYKSFHPDQNDGTTYIFECTLLQNHVNQLFAVYGLDYDEVQNHVVSLLDNIKTLKPIILYIKQENISNTLNRISKERISPNKNMHSDWIDMAIQYTENTLFGQKHTLKGRELLLDYLVRRQQIEEEILQMIDVESHIVHLQEDYDLVFEQIVSILSKK